MDIVFFKELFLTILSILGIVIPLCYLIKNIHNAEKSNLKNMLCAFYAEEQEAVDWIASITKKNKKTIKIELRNRAANNNNNKTKTHPTKPKY